MKTERPGPSPPWPTGLYRVEGPGFVAGFEIENGRLKRIAPILRQHFSGNMATFQLRCQRRGWRYERVLGDVCARCAKDVSADKLRVCCGRPFCEEPCYSLHLDEDAHG